MIIAGETWKACERVDGAVVDGTQVTGLLLFPTLLSPFIVLFCLSLFLSLFLLPSLLLFLCFWRASKSTNASLSREGARLFLLLLLAYLLQLSFLSTSSLLREYSCPNRDGPKVGLPLSFWPSLTMFGLWWPCESSLIYDPPLLSCFSFLLSFSLLPFFLLFFTFLYSILILFDFFFFFRSRMARSPCVDQLILETDWHPDRSIDSTFNTNSIHNKA